MINSATIKSESTQKRRIPYILNKTFPHLPHTFKYNDLKIEKLNGGISNSLYLITTLKMKLLVRFYGEVRKNTINIEYEGVVKKILQKNDFGNKIYYEFDGGHVSNYIEGIDLLHTDLARKDIQILIAKKLAKLHKTNFHPLKQKITVWTTILKWLNKLSTSKLKKYHNSLTLSSIKSSIEVLRCNLSNTSSPIVLCHNDIHANNIIYHSNTIKLIDFEYSSTNPSAYDISNHFNEYCGFDYDTKKYPSDSSKENFIREYLSEYLNVEKNHINYENIKILMEEVNRFRCVSDLFWGIWAIISSEKSSNNDFDYKGYAKKRLDSYLKLNK